MASILFVDDEPLFLRALERTFRPLESEFQAVFAASGAEALDRMAERPFDVLVSDMRMPGMDGATLLARSQKQFPSTARVILSGYAQDETLLRALPVSHRFLSKPLQPTDLKLMLYRTLSLHQLLESQSLRELVGGFGDLPTRPTVYFELRSALADERTSMREIARIVERDAGITGRLLRAVNNAFFAPASRISSVQQAIQHLGTHTLVSLTLSLECFGSFEDRRESDVVPGTLERKAFLAASIAQGLLQDRVAQQDAFMGGLLHDSGLLLIASRKPEMVKAASNMMREEGCTLIEAERKLWGVNHAEIGAYLLGLWGLPYPVVESVARCHTPSHHQGSDIDVGSAVYLAAAFAEAALNDSLHSVSLDEAMLARVGLRDRLPELMATVERIVGRAEPAAEAMTSPRAG